MNRYLSAALAVPIMLVPAAAFASATTSAFAAPIHFDPTWYLIGVLAALAVSILLVRGGVRALVVVLLTVVAVSISLDVAFAAGASAPETVAQSVSENTKVTWAWGEAAQSVAAGVLYILGMVAMFLFRKLPENIVAIIGNARVELLLTNAKNWGINAVKDATKDKQLSVDVGNAVLAQALGYALTNGSGWLQQWAGGPEGLAKKLWSRLNLEPAADASAVPMITAVAVSDAQKTG